MKEHSLDTRCINTIRFLSVDAVEKANSGHPGAPMGLAPAAFVLWDRFLKHNPQNPDWPNRDRFVLSAGHASMLLYSLLHLTGYDLPLKELKQFRQFGSKTPGHPEYGETPGVEITTGPLGQGFANGVGMAFAQQYLAQRFNTSDHKIIDHNIYAIVSDGDLQEGLSSEAASLAGTLGLGRLIYLYDDNGIQIDGRTDRSFREDVGKRFDAYGWQVIGPVDGNDCDAIEQALRDAQSESDRPSLIMIKTIIGFGSPKQGTAAVHGAPLGSDGVLAAKQTLNWPQEPTFHVPDDVKKHMGEAVARGSDFEREWQTRFDAYATTHPDSATELQAAWQGTLPDDWDKGLNNLFDSDSKPMATRNASAAVLNHLENRLPALIGGSADLHESNKTKFKNYGDFIWDKENGRNIYFGVREHAMGAIANGMAVYGGVIPFTATFLTFSDYMRPAMRLAALTGLRAIYVFTHDSIGLGEDGPTHQPIEHLMSLRAMPNMTVIRPADATETAQAWQAAILNSTGPTTLVLSRQNLPVIDRKKYAPASGLHRGAYTLWDSSPATPEVIVIATGSEVEIAMDAARTLAAEDTAVRVVSMPCWEFFEQQPQQYRDTVLPPEVTARVAIEAGIRFGWERYVGLKGAIIGMDTFGASAPADVLYEKFGITADHVVKAARSMIQRENMTVGATSTA